MQAFKTRCFAEWAPSQLLTDDALTKAITEMEQGLIDAEVGGHLVKKRVALPGKGKRGSARTLVAFNRGYRAFFMYGFTKKERANIGVKELPALNLLARQLFSYTHNGLTRAIDAGEFIEVENDG
jgi:hypothetical protein